MHEDDSAVLIVTPLPLEFRAMSGHLSEARSEYHPKGTFFMIGAVPGVPGRVVLVSPGDGNLSTAVLAERGIARYRPRALLVVGIAGSLKSDVGICDVVVSTWIHAYHGGKEDDTGFSARPRSRPAAHRLEQVATAVSLRDSWSDGLEPFEDRRPQVHLKPIAAGEVVLNSQTAPLALQLKRHYGDAVAIEMESAGSTTAAHLNDDLPTLTIRGISDLADGEKHLSDSAGLQPAAAERAAAFAVAFLRELPVAEAAARDTGQAAPPTGSTVARTQNVRADGNSTVYVVQDGNIINHSAYPAPALPAPPRAAATWRLLDMDLPVTWLSDLDRTAPGVLEVHMIPVDRTSRLELSRLDGLGPELAGLGRQGALFKQMEGLREFTTATSSGVAATDTRHTAGLAVTRTGQRSIWSALPKDSLGPVLDEADVVPRLTEMIHLLLRAPIDLPAEVGFALRVESAVNLTEDRVADLPRSRATLNVLPGEIQVTADDATLTADLAPRAAAVARELAARLLAEFRSGRPYKHVSL